MCAKIIFQNSHACLRFSSNQQIKTSQLYVIVHELVTEVDRQNRDIRFERLHARCVSLLRLIYRYRKRCDEMLVFRIVVFASKFVTLCIEIFKITVFFYSLHYVEQNSYGYTGNENIKLAAACVYASTMITYPQCSNAALNKIVQRTYLNESLLRKLGQSVQEFYTDYTGNWTHTAFTIWSMLIFNCI